MTHILLVAALIILNLLDLLTTYLGIKSGKAREVNPIIAALFKKMGWVAMVGIKTLAILALLYWQDMLPIPTLTIITVAYVGVVINNYRVYKK